MSENPEEAAMSVRSRWMLITVYSMIVSGSCEVSEGRLRGSVELPCRLPPPGRAYVLEELLVYWQRQLGGEEALVVGFIGGKECKDQQHEDYKGRASLNPDNVARGDLALRLSRLSLRDNGRYKCLVFNTSDSFSRLHESHEELRVTAEYSAPVITMGSTRGPLTCTTQGGIPRPEIRWINAGDGTPMGEGQTRIDEDDDFINVTSSIALNVTSATNVTCVVMTASGNLTSDPFFVSADELEGTEENPGAGKHEGVAPGVRNSVITIVVVLVIAALVGIVVLKRKLLPLTGCSQRVEYHHGKAEV